MKQVVVLGGTGGAGKTTVAAALVHLASQELSIVAADADVTAGSLQQLLSPTKVQEHDFSSGKVAVIDPQACTACGTCAQACRFEAIVPGETSYSINRVLCQGCHSCFYQCPAHAIRMQEKQAGQWFQSVTRFGPLFHGRLFAGQETSGKLITLMKQQARLTAQNTGAALLIVDGPPSSGSPAIAASAGANLALLVLDPATSGTHDLEQTLATMSDSRVPVVVCINKADLNSEHSASIETYCRAQGVGLVGKVPYDTAAAEAMVKGQPVTVHQPEGLASAALREMWGRIGQELRKRA